MRHGSGVERLEAERRTWPSDQCVLRRKPPCRCVRVSAIRVAGTPLFGWLVLVSGAETEN